MELINFDYFVKRGTVLTEMARPSTKLGRDPRIQEAVPILRKHLRLNHGYAQPSSAELASYRYLFNLLDE